MSLAEWSQETRLLTTVLAERYPKRRPDLEDLAHPTGHPTCPKPNPKRPELQACLVCQILRAHPRAAAMTATSDGLRSPSLEPGSRPIGSHSDPTWSAIATRLPGREDADDERRTTDAPPKPAKPLPMLTSDSHRRETVTALRLALSTEDESERRRHIHDARTHATHALSALHRLLPATNTIRRLTPAGDPGCASCHRNGVYSPTIRGANGRCSWCYKWFLANGELPDLALLADHHDGKRITSLRVADVERAKRERQRARAKAQPKRRKAKR